MNRFAGVDETTLESHPEQPQPQRLALAERESASPNVPMVTVCQCNIREGGKWTGPSRNEAIYDTARRFARFVASPDPTGSSRPAIGVIGMQEVNDRDHEMILGLLSEETGAEWRGEHTEQGDSGIAIFHRPGIVEPAPGGDLGDVVLCRLANDYPVKFMGRVFQTPDGEGFAFITGKFPWKGAILRGKAVTDADRVECARTLRSWIGERLGDEPPATIIATDLNSPYASPVWRDMNVKYSDPSRQRTYNSFSGILLDLIGKRFDYLWLSRTYRARFTDGPRRSPHFGSDHRAAYATVEFLKQA